MVSTPASLSRKRADAADESRSGAAVLGRFIDAVDLDSAVERVVGWGRGRESRTVCLCNVHSLVTALDDEALASALSRADLALPDGAPVAWMLRRKGFHEQRRVAGPDLMARLCDRLQNEQVGVFLFGSRSETLDRLQSRLGATYPNLEIRGALSPAFGAWSEEQLREYLSQINGSGAGVIFVGLGCPKQEIWMAEHHAALRGVLVGVGAAFDFHAGAISRAPLWVQRLGLEWFHRLLSEPRRLWKRYLTTNSRFVYYVLREVIRGAR